MEGSCVRDGERCGWSGKLMPQRDALEGRDGDANPEEGQQGPQHQGLPPGPDGNLQLGP